MAKTKPSTIVVLHGVRGALTNERYIPAGTYDLGDPKLLGVGEQLVEMGEARPYGETYEQTAVAQPSNAGGVPRDISGTVLLPTEAEVERALMWLRAAAPPGTDLNTLLPPVASLPTEAQVAAGAPVGVTVHIPPETPEEGVTEEALQAEFPTKNVAAGMPPPPPISMPAPNPPKERSEPVTLTPAQKAAQTRAAKEAAKVAEAAKADDAAKEE